MVYAFVLKTNDTQVLFPLWENEKEEGKEAGFIEHPVSCNTVWGKSAQMNFVEEQINKCLMPGIMQGVSRNIFSIYSSQHWDTGVISPFLQKG